MTRMSDTVFTHDEQHSIRQPRIWPRLLAFPILAVVGQTAFFAGVSEDSWPVQLSWVAVLSYCWFCIAGVSHELIHQTLPIPRRLCVWLGRVIGTMLGTPYSVYRAIHVTHHAYLNTPLDWELWPYSDPRRGLWFRRLFVWFDIACGFLATPIIYQRICYSSESPVPPAERRRMRIEYLFVFLFWGTVIGSLAWLEIVDTIHLTMADLVHLSPLLIASSVNSLRKLTGHLGLASYDPVEGTRTIIGRHWWTRCLSYFDFELWIHGPHHRFPKQSHHQLENSMRQLELRDPERTLPVFHSFHSAFFDVLPWLFRNPAVGMNAGNKAPLTHLPNIDNFVTDVLSDVVLPGVSQRKDAKDAEERKGKSEP